MSSHIKELMELDKRRSHNRKVIEELKRDVKLDVDAAVYSAATATFSAFIGSLALNFPNVNENLGRVAWIGVFGLGTLVAIANTIARLLDKKETEVQIELVEKDNYAIDKEMELICKRD